MAKSQKRVITITLSEDTVDRLEFLCNELGLLKSQAISYLINTVIPEKYGYSGKGESNESK